jgi:transcriptional regulator with PAS, ATPase and Fis domain
MTALSRNSPVVSSNIASVKTRFSIVGHHTRLISAVDIAIQVAPTDVSALIIGENGTGKDVFSRIIHQFSKRKHAPFIAINTGAIPEGTMDSELFGHEKGAFTGAIDARKGYFEEVEGGTIFLDEIGEMPMATQARLLRLLENGEYLRVGSSKVRKADVRVIAATNKNLIELIRKGRFREDLYFRLNTVTINVPPLRERGDDIDILFNYFSEEFGNQYRRNPLILTQEASDLLQKYRWPGNVRELKNFVERLSVLVHDDLIDESIVHQHLDIRESYLPVFAAGLPNGHDYAGTESRPEIEMLYKLVLDMRSEMNDLKKILYSGIQPGIIRESEANGYYVEDDPQEPVRVAYVPAGEDYTIESPTISPREKSPRVLDQPLNLEANEKDLILRALSKNGHNRKKAAKELGISERTLYRKIKEYDIA